MSKDLILFLLFTFSEDIVNDNIILFMTDNLGKKSSEPQLIRNPAGAALTESEAEARLSKEGYDSYQTYES